MSRVEERMTSLEVEAKRIRDRQQDILELFGRLEARAEAGGCDARGAGRCSNNGHGRGAYSDDMQQFGVIHEGSKHKPVREHAGSHTCRLVRF